MSGYFGGSLGYVKKEDAVRVLKYQRLYPTIIAASLVAVMGVMEKWVVPKLSELYVETKIVLPFYATSTFRWIVLGIIIMILLKLPINTEKELLDKLKKYRAGEMILITDLMDMKREWVVLALVGLMVACLIVSIVLPIYQITNTL